MAMNEAGKMLRAWLIAVAMLGIISTECHGRRLPLIEMPAMVGLATAAASWAMASIGTYALTVLISLLVFEPLLLRQLPDGAGLKGQILRPIGLRAEA